MYITGPAILTLGSGSALYFEAGIDVKLKSKTGKLTSDIHGTVGEFLQSRSAVITGKPEGFVTAGYLATLFPYGDTNIGSSLFTGTDVPLVIQTLAGQTITWPRGALTKSPTLDLAANKPLYNGNVEFTCLGAATTSMETSPTAAGHFNAVASNAFADTSYATTSRIQDSYTAAFGSSPYNAMTAQEGFQVTMEQENAEIMDDLVGIGDIVLKSLSVSCKFIPSNLTEAQVWTLVNLQNTAAQLPGMPFTSANNLVIAGANAAGLTATILKPGFVDAEVAYKTGKLRVGEIMASAFKTFTAGVANSLLAFSIA